MNTDYRQLPPSAAGPPPATQAYPYGPVGPSAMPPGMPVGVVPPVPPPARSAGWWVGVTAAVTAGVLVALLGGFFIGRETRLANSDVQTRIDAQAQTDRIAQERALNDQRRDMLRRQRTLVGRVSAKAEARGVRRGRAEGYNEGQSVGFSQGQTQGFAQGQTEGYDSGLDTGACLADYFFC
jgi:hypothetical protein